MRPFRAKRLVWALLLACALAACGGGGEDYDGEDDTPPTLPEIPNDSPVQQPSALVCPNGSYLTYRNFGAAFMNKYCTSCHAAAVPEEKRAGAPLAANFDTALDVAQWRVLILQRAAAATGTTMPPSGQVTTADREALAEWLNCGAPR